MKDRRRLAAVLAAAAIAAFVPLVTPSVAQAAAPPWEPDPNSLGTVAFYDSTGHQITGGNNLSHLADYYAASTAAPGSPVKATLYFAAPDHQQPEPLNWFVQQQSGSTFFPNNNAPAPLKGPGFAKPLVTAGATDGNLTSFIGNATMDQTAGYANIVQVRVRTNTDANHYWVADVRYDKAAGTWTQIFPVVNAVTPTTTTLAASPASPSFSGTNVTFTATVSPSAPGSVAFKEGGTTLGTGSVASGHATFSTSTLSVGSHTITAQFTPSSADFSGSTSGPLTYVVNAVPAPAWKPTLFGTVRVSSKVTCVASFDFATSVQYAWFKNGAAIAGATASTYTIPESLYEQKLSCSVTASGPGGTASGTSGQSTVAVGPTLRHTTAARITGIHRVGRVNTCSAGSFSPAATSLAYQWKRNGVSIKGATHGTYRLVAADRTKRISCTVVARRNAWTPTTVSAPAVKVS